ncbi:amino acid ABC transporter ATP-binding/permease protein [Niveispirillum fermenti]|uniref:amino acid ABC transporter ATP-binding/permease protein n=1 Tax=Niveispirillum fermenti TaxID=1233113 RepID=UPI003A87EE9F
MNRDIALFLRLFRRAAPRAFWSGLLLSALTIVAGTALLGLSGWFITAAGIAGAVAATALAFDVFRPGAGVRMLAITRTGARYAERLVTHDATLSVIADLRVRMFRALARPGQGQALDKRPGRLLFRLTGDLDALDGLYLRLAVPLAALLLLSLGLGIALTLVVGWPGLLLGLVPAGLGASLLWSLGRASRGPGGRRAAALESLRLRLLDRLAGRVDWRMTGREQAMDGLTLAAERRLAEADDQLNRLEVKSGLVQGLAAVLLPAAGLLVAAFLVEAGRLGAAGAALVLLTLLGALEPLAALRRGAADLGRMARAARRVATGLGSTSGSPPCPATPPAGSALCLDRVRHIQPDAQAPLFDGLSLYVPIGQHVAITGDSGAGKSTLLALLTGEAAPLSGQVAALPAALLAQDTTLFRDSIAANLRLADPFASVERLWQVLADAGLERVVREMPAGLETLLGESGHGLSAGQRRRLTLARFLLQNKPLWLLDEVTEGVDASVAGTILTNIKANGRDRTILLVTHLRREAALADRLIRLQGGRVVMDEARGTPAFDTALQALRQD